MGIQPVQFNLEGVKPWDQPAQASIAEGYYQGTISSLDERKKDGVVVGVGIGITISDGEFKGRKVNSTFWYPRPDDRGDLNKGRLAALAKALGFQLQNFVLSDALLNRPLYFYYQPRDEAAGMKDDRVTPQSFEVWSAQRAHSGSGVVPGSAGVPSDLQANIQAMLAMQAPAQQTAPPPAASTSISADVLNGLPEHLRAAIVAASR